MSSVGFAIFCLASFVVPIPLIAWLDRAPGSRAEQKPPGR